MCVFSFRIQVQQFNIANHLEPAKAETVSRCHILRICCQHFHRALLAWLHREGQYDGLGCGLDFHYATFQMKQFAIQDYLDAEGRFKSTSIRDQTCRLDLEVSSRTLLKLS